MDESSQYVALDHEEEAPPSLDHEEETPPSLDQDQRQSIDAWLAQVKQQSFLHKMGCESEMAQEAGVIEFLLEEIKASTARMKASKTTHEKLLILAGLLGELDFVDGLSFPLLPMLVSEIEAVEGLGPFPSSDTVLKMADELGDLASTEVTENVSANMHGFAWYKLVRGELDPEEESEVRARGATFRDKMDLHLEKMWEGVSEVPVLHFFVRNLLLAVRDYNEQVMFTANWQSILTRLANPLPNSNLTCASWPSVGALCQTAIETECVSKEAFSRCFSTFASAMEDVQNKVLPKFALRLVQLSGLLQAQVEESKQAKAKVLASLVTAGVTFGNFFMNYLQKKYSDGPGDV